MKEAITIDVRSLGVFRIAVAALVLFDLATRFPNLEAHYSDAGITPRLLAAAQHPGLTTLSLHFLSGSVVWQGILFAVAVLFATALLVGYRSRIATIGSWYLLMSLQSRNEALNYGADDLLRTLLFWAMFLPLDRAFVVGRPSGGSANVDGEKRLASVGTAMILIQLSLVYSISAVFKFVAGSHWFPDGTAVATVFANPTLTRDAAAWALGYPVLLKFATYGTLVLEAAAPLLLLPLFKPRVLRAFAFVSFFALHAGIIVFQKLGYFPYVSMAALFLLLPTGFWERAPYAVPSFRVAKIEWAAPAFMALVLAWNVTVLSERMGSPTRMPASVDAFVKSIRLEQRWSMFARPPRGFFWYQIVGVDAGGRPVDPWAGKSTAPPTGRIDPQNIFDDARWATYVRYPANPFAGPYEAEKQPFAEYFCRKWNARAATEAERLRTVEVYYKNAVDNRRPDDVTEDRLWAIDCPA